MDNYNLKTDKIVVGINKACSLIEGAYGASGGNVIIEHEYYPYYICTNDGRLIVSATKLHDPEENIGKNIISESGDKAEKDSGDGRKTTMILSKAIVSGIAEVKDVPLMDIKYSLDECLPIIHKAIDEQTKEITADNVAEVATVSSGNEKIGKILQEIYQKVGKDGMVEIDNSNIPETFYEITDGVRLRNAGFMYPYMGNTDKGRSATYLVPKVLIVKDKITSLSQIDKIFKSLSEKNIFELVIMCDEIDQSVSEGIAFMHINGVMKPDGTTFKFKTLIIKAPTLWKDLIYEDFAKITGATIVDSTQGTSFKTLGFHHLGTCDKIVSTEEETRVIGIHDITEHLAKLEAEDSDNAKLRLAWLKTKAAILKVGANSETELKYLSLKTSDARNASYLALKGGVVPGGGITLSKAVKDLPDTVGGNILKKALLAPMTQIIVNTRKDHSKMDMIKAGIIDPALVTKNAIKNAISVAGTILTGNAVITLNKTQNDVQR